MNGRGEVQRTTQEARATAITGEQSTGFCAKCGAWRGCLGLEPTPETYVAHIVQVFREVRRVLRDDGTLWLNLGDAYCTAPRGNREGDFSTSSLTNPQRQDKLWGKHKYRGQQREPRASRGSALKHKDLIGLPWRVAFALQADGWYLRSDIIWHKPNPMPESVRDRPTKAHEYVFLLSKSERYYFNFEAWKEPTSHAHEAIYDNGRNGHGGGESHRGQGSSTRKFAESDPANRNRRSVWTIPTKPYKDAHFATFPPDLIKPCILAGCPEGGVVLDPFLGSGTTAEVARQLNCTYIGIELNPKYAAMARKRLEQQLLNFQPE